MWPLVLLGLGLYAVKRFYDAKKAAPATAPDGTPLAPDAQPTADGGAPQDDGGGGGGGGGGGAYTGGPNDPSQPFSWHQVSQALRTPHLAAKYTPDKIAASDQSFASKAGATLITSAQAPSPSAPPSTPVASAASAVPRINLASVAAAVVPKPPAVAPKPGTFTGVIKR